MAEELQVTKKQKWPLNLANSLGRGHTFPPRLTYTRMKRNWCFWLTCRSHFRAGGNRSAGRCTYHSR